MAAAVMVAFVGGCGSIADPASQHAVPSLAASPTTSPSVAPPLSIGTLPAATLDPATVTALCDPEPSQADTAAGESTVSCGDGLVLGLRAIETTATSPITRLYLRRMPCPTLPCTTDELATALVTGWAADGPRSVTLDSRLTTTAAPVGDPLAAWPSGGMTSTPAVARPAIANAPAEVKGRTAFPDCGSSELDADQAAFDCFMGAVLHGTPAEMVEHVQGTEGGAITWLYRFPGQGAVRRYAADSGHWDRQDGSLILGPLGHSWDFDPWSGTETPLS